MEREQTTRKIPEILRLKWWMLIHMRVGAHEYKECKILI